MSHSESFPALRKQLQGSGSIMGAEYRVLFEQYVHSTKLSLYERRMLRFYLVSPEGGRLSALNAIAELRSQHLDALMKETK